MIPTEKITIAGKEVCLTYNFATEVAYNEFTDEFIGPAIVEIAQSLNSKTAFDTRKGIYLTLAAHMAYTEVSETKPTIVDKDLLTNCTPVELATAVGTVIKMWGEFYNIPKNEPKPKKGKKGKN